MQKIYRPVTTLTPLKCTVQRLQCLQASLLLLVDKRYHNLICLPCHPCLIVIRHQLQCLQRICYVVDMAATGFRRFDNRKGNTGGTRKQICNSALKKGYGLTSLELITGLLNVRPMWGLDIHCAMTGRCTSRWAESISRTSWCQPHSVLTASASITNTCGLLIIRKTQTQVSVVIQREGALSLQHSDM